MGTLGATLKLNSKESFDKRHPITELKFLLCAHYSKEPFPCMAVSIMGSKTQSIPYQTDEIEKAKRYYSFYKAVNSRVCALSRSLREVFQKGARSGKRHLSVLLLALLPTLLKHLTGEGQLPNVYYQLT